VSLWSRLRNTLRGRQLDDDIDDELRFHLEMDAAGGQTPRNARVRLGNVARIREEMRQVSIIHWLESAVADARYGLRQLRSAPVLVAAVLLSLTVGLGASTAVFALVDAAILRPLPVADPDALVILEWTAEDFPPGVTNLNGEYRPIDGGLRRGSSMSAAIYRALAREQSGFGALIGIGAYPDPIAVAVDGAPAQQASIQYVSANFFQALGITPLVGRAFGADEDRAGQEPLVVISHRLWRSHFAGDRGVIDRTIRINSVPARIVGVAPPGFFGTRAGQWPDVYAPLAVKLAFLPSSATAARAEDDGNWWVRVVGRLQPGVPEAAARQRLDAQFRGMVSARATDAAPGKIPQLVSTSGRRGFESLGLRDRDALWTLLLLVGVLLAIVCANVANLLLSRSVVRHHESALRLALGATRARVFRQHMIEAAVLSVAGGAAGLFVGDTLARSIHLLFQTGRDASSAFDLHLDGRVMAYTTMLSMVSALAFGLAPAWRASRAGLGDAVKAQARSVVGGRLRLPRALVSVQIALCLAALVAAGLLGQSLARLKAIDIGFERDHIAYATVSPSRAGYTPDRNAAYAERVREALAQLPGIVHVALLHTRPLSGGGNAAPVNMPGRPPRVEGSIANSEDFTQTNAVGEGFFETMGIPLVAGRVLDRRDVPVDAAAVVVDETFARRFLAGQDPIGRRFGLGIDAKGNTRYEVVGVVGNSRYNSLRNDLAPTMYQAYRAGGTVNLAIRSAIDPLLLNAAVREAIASIDPSVPLTEFHTQTALIDRTLRTERMLGVISGALGAIALSLSAIGLAGLLAYIVARRRTEIGVRMALGASARDVVAMVLRDSCWLVAIGIAIGLPCAYAVSRTLRTLLFQLDPLDLPTTAFAFLVLCAVALAAAWLPARRAARIDAMSALRQE
jgi:macrolide transport system ATP-binding/permease protein